MRRKTLDSAYGALVLLAACTAGASGEPPATQGDRRVVPEESATAERSQNVSLHLAVRFRENAPAELVSATELRGRSIVSNAAKGDYVIEVRAGERLIAVEGVADPFEMHSFGGPDVPHHEGRLDEATVTVRLPGVGLESAELDSLVVRLLRADTGGEPIGTLSAETLERLRASNALESISATAPGSLGPAIREKGTRSSQ